MLNRHQLIAGAATLLLSAAILLPAIADARGSGSRRNYADEMRRDRIRDDREDERREREERHYKESAERQERYYEHREKQSDKYIAHSDRVWGTTPAGSGASPARSAGPCMYGTNNEVIHRPAGAVCRGDKPAPARAVQQPTAKHAPAKETKGTCVYGKSGKLMWSSPGAKC
ncbi:MAG: hypothetical protein JRH01_13375 [Deltaproteobacteria bacterium]|nr:hypothetical protein [Deltaproteobacteria bacterium]MBW2393717.1 hypothetical protein [Deltaproteobacteria bacterium]